MSEESDKKSRKAELLDKFLGGLVSSIGSWVGTTIVVGIFVFFLSRIDLVPIVGSFVASLMKYVTTANPPFMFK